MSTTQEIIDWLNSPASDEWREGEFFPISHYADCCLFASVKDDDDHDDCLCLNNYFGGEYDSQIAADILNGRLVDCTDDKQIDRGWFWLRSSKDFKPTMYDGRRHP